MTDAILQKAQYLKSMINNLENLHRDMTDMGCKCNGFATWNHPHGYVSDNVRTKVMDNDLNEEILGLVDKYLARYKEEYAKL